LILLLFFLLNAFNGLLFVHGMFILLSLGFSSSFVRLSRLHICWFWYKKLSFVLFLTLFMLCFTLEWRWCCCCCCWLWFIIHQARCALSRVHTCWLVCRSVGPKRLSSRTRESHHQFLLTKLNWSISCSSKHSITHLIEESLTSQQYCRHPRRRSCVDHQMAVHSDRCRLAFYARQWTFRHSVRPRPSSSQDLSIANLQRQLRFSNKFTVNGRSDKKFNWFQMDEFLLHFNLQCANSYWFIMSLNECHHVVTTHTHART